MSSLDQTFFTNVLRKFENDFTIQVETVEKTNACESGNNFMAVVRRITLCGTKNDKVKQWKLITKELSEGCMFNVDEAFENEVFAYKTIIPTLSQYSTKPFAFPKCLYASKQLIVLEDLTTEGFQNVDKCIGLKYDHIKSCVKELANLHAASIILKNKDPEKFKEISNKTIELVFTPEKNTAVDSQEYFLEWAKELLQEQGESDFLNIINDLTGNTFYLQRSALFKKRDITVINHGDCWCNNVLVNDNQVKFIDFQLMRTTSVAVDLSYLLYINMNPSERISKEDEILNLYLCHLNECLRKAHLDELSRRWLDNEMEDFKLFGYLHGMWLLPLFYEDFILNSKPSSAYELPSRMRDRILALTKEYCRRVLQNQTFTKSFELMVLKDEKLIN